MKAPPQLAPPPYQPADAEALQALQRGDCPPHLQQRALDWIIRRAAAAYDLSFSPHGETLTAFAEGRRFVGLQVIKLLALDLEKLT